MSKRIKLLNDISKKGKILLSIQTKEYKIEKLYSTAFEYWKNRNFQEVVDICDTIIDLQRQIKNFYDLLKVNDKNEFNEEYEFLKKYMEIK